MKEWDELQGMIGLDTVKLSIRSLIDGLLLNYCRELNEQEPLQISLSRLFLGPPGTGKSYHLYTLTSKQFTPYFAWPFSPTYTTVSG